LLLIFGTTQCFGQTVFNGQFVFDAVDIVTNGFQCAVPPYDIKPDRIVDIHTHTGDYKFILLKTDTVVRTYSPRDHKPGEAQTRSSTNEIPYKDLASVAVDGNKITFQCRGRENCIYATSTVRASEFVNKAEFRVCDETIAAAIKEAADFLISFGQWKGWK